MPAKPKPKCYACRVSSAADEAIKHPSRTSFNSVSILLMKALEKFQSQESFCEDHQSRFEKFAFMVLHKVNRAGKSHGLCITN